MVTSNFFYYIKKNIYEKICLFGFILYLNFGSVGSVSIYLQNHKFQNVVEYKILYWETNFFILHKKLTSNLPQIRYTATRVQVGMYLRNQNIKMSHSKNYTKRELDVNSYMDIFRTQ